MSLFDDAMGGESGFKGTAFGPQEGFAGVLLCASACDGHIADSESNNLFLILGQRKLYKRMSEQQFGAMFDRLFKVLKKSGPEALLEKCYPVVPEELHETVFANAVDIIMANGSVEDEEKEFLDSLLEKLELDETRAKTIIKVMSYKNRG
jgi:hypothetical protein